MGLSPESKARGEKLVSGGKFVPRAILVDLEPAECRLEEAGGQHGPLPPPPLLHARLCPPHCSWQPAVQATLRARTHPTDVRRQEHDDCLRPQAWKVPDRCSRLPWPHVDERGEEADVECAEQELSLLR